ncbi:calpain family cysteine protease [Colletotrichum navitas]|uniref:Calpain family cysteine protease n=1 Tax=Colletotrichum navitas TaxID=681940 RepID=A0AAD8UZ00_9PEZI|nr:calpain family cysteine protease [Colletotrichum navitas]KAK1573117.1 calpain family cysteine protease [Colletotrichum navitas]
MHGYSSSEESDDPRRPRPVPASNNNNDQKKKKKKRAPPQPSINHIWKRFQDKKFNKALAVLPFDPVPPPASSEKPNELLTAGYERAAEECRRKVRKIIQECRRVNMRYRDPGWDLDWDLKWEKGHCLNTLGHTKWQLSRSTLSNPSASVPKAVKRVHEIFEKPTFMKNINGGDVKQGSLGDCWLMATMTALANVEGGIERTCVEYDTRIGIYGFVFYRDGEWIYSIIDDKLYLKSPCWDSPSMQRDLLQQIDREDVERVYRKTYQTGSKALFFAQCKDQNETWVPLLEKAYAKAHGDYASLSGGWIGEGLEDLSGGVTTELLTSDILDTDGFWENELSKVNEEFLFGCSTGLLDGGYGEREGISEGHAYVIMEARTLKSGERLIKLRNPWGKIRKGVWEGAWSDGSKEWTMEVQEELGHHFGNDSVFWINYDDFLRKYQHIDRTRLFRDPAWRCAQRWIGVDVPWKSQFNEKFQIKLTKDGPLCLVLSQLDNRYFKGLQGQYVFRIHFRIHERGRPGAEDYIVRSHGNYLMDRSVSIELPDMPAGEYSIFMSVTGERDTSLPSVEAVVKRECRKRVENDKLVQVGSAYDLAHSKGAAHLEEVARLRKVKEQQRASESRQKERRKLWERRHLNREITKKQTKKNNEKRDRRRAKVEEEAKKKAEEAKKKEDELAEKHAVAAKQAEEAKQKVEEGAKKDTDAKTKDAAGTEKEEETKTMEAEKPNDKAVQTNAVKEVPKEDKPDQNEAGSSEETQKPTEVTNDKSVPDNNAKDGVEGDSKTESKGEPKKDAANEKPVAQPAPAPAPAQKVEYDSADDSSDSPIEDWEELYSDDDMVRKPRLTPSGPPKTRDERYESEEEGLPDPWNAICIVGVRVYSMDEDLEVHVVMEGGELLEGGMGKKGEADLDNAQVNAGGEREKLGADNIVNGVKAESAKPQDKTASETVVAAPADGKECDQKDGDDTTKEANEDSKSETSVDSDRSANTDKTFDSSGYDKMDSGTSTPEVIATPEATPLETNKELF